MTLSLIDNIIFYNNLTTTAPGCIITKIIKYHKLLNEKSMQMPKCKESRRWWECGDGGVAEWAHEGGPKDLKCKSCCRQVE